jgi:capsule polysaccharide modification protein KpsS
MHPKRHKQLNNALILQGDWEGGLTNFALDLIDRGSNVTKVLLHAGDWIYKWKGVPTVNYDAPLEDFEQWLRSYVIEHKVDSIILYNQYRPYNQIGWDVAKELGLECIVLELGLLRPDFCSIYSRERNHFDYLEKRWDKVLKKGKELSPPEKPAQLARMSTPCKMTQFGLYFLFSRLMATIVRQYTHYRDQRTLNVWHHLVANIKGALRFQGRKKQSCFDKIFAGKWSGKYYFVPLQVHTDSQITIRSNFKSMEEFIHLVVDSFKLHAPKGTKLVFKVHPMDRGYKDYHQLIKKLREEVGGHRILYLDRIHLPTALENARACITVNSSVGLSALIHNTPLITLGEAAFNLKGLTYQDTLDSFWQQHGQVSKKNVNNFVALLKQTSQAQGTFYQRLYSSPGRCKIAWPADFAPLFGNNPDLVPHFPTQETFSNIELPSAEPATIQ